MLTDKEIEFMAHWEMVRIKQSTFWYKMIAGLPKALLFYLPLPISVFLIDILMPEWYYRVSGKALASMPSVMIGLLIAVFFLSFFYMQFKWETNENHYLYLKSKLELKSKSLS